MRASIHSRPVIFSGHFCDLRIELMIGASTILTAFGLIDLTMARDADCADVLTEFILSPTAASVRGRREMRYGSKAGETVEC